MTQKTGNPQLLLRLPAALRAAVIATAKAKSVTAQAIILGIVAHHYGITDQPPVRGRPRKMSTPRRRR